jgi:hypothetical protein
MTVNHRINGVRNFGILVSVLLMMVKRRPGQTDTTTTLPNRKLIAEVWENWTGA